VKIDRRRAIAHASALGAATLVYHRGSILAQSSTPSASPVASPNASPVAAEDGLQADGSWVFTDDRERTVVIDHLPERIFADLQAGLSLYEFGIVPVGQIGYSGVYEMPAELADVPFLDLGTSGGEFDVEAIAGMTPDLSVGITWDVNSKADFGGFPEEEIPGFTDIAPTICILGVVVPASVSVERFGELAKALGADIETPEIADARAAYEDAAQAVRDAVAAKPGLKVIAVSPTPDALWIGNPTVASDLVLFAELGVEFVVPDAPDEANSGLFQELSWEQVGNYQADLYLVDSREFAIDPEELLAQPTFALLPAAQAGQFSTWAVEYITTYAGLTTLAEAINASEIVTG
jgi:iron complex transport system substrate-binding protein